VKVVTEIDTFFFMQGYWNSKRAYGNFEMWKRFGCNIINVK